MHCSRARCRVSNAAHHQTNPPPHTNQAEMWREWWLTHASVVLGIVGAHGSARAARSAALSSAGGHNPHTHAENFGTPFFAKRTLSAQDLNATRIRAKKQHSPRRIFDLTFFGPVGVFPVLRFWLNCTTWCNFLEIEYLNEDFTCRPIPPGSPSGGC